jgi:hypothetical protein
MASCRKTDLQKPSTKILADTIDACVANGNKLRDESYDFEFREPPSLQLYVLLIAQEEFAKAFLLLLVRDEIVPFSRPLLRAMNDHACKHLVGLIMDYIIMRWDTLEEAQALISADVDLGDRLPPSVESAVMLLRFEKVGRWQSRAWEWDDPPKYDIEAKKIAEGKADRRKQDALYVRIGADGRVCPPSSITAAQIDEEKERLTSFRYLVDSLLNGAADSYRYKKAISFIRDMFAERV